MLSIQYAETRVVKGVSHCLLPECNRITWPFMNYCSKTHAQIGKKRGLIRKSSQFHVYVEEMY